MAGLTNSQWARVQATLPPGTNAVWFRGEFEHIVGDRVPPRTSQRIHLKRAQLCRDLMCELPHLEHIKDKNALGEQLVRQQQEEENLAHKYGRIAKQKQPIFFKYCLALDLWVCAGGHLPIRTPHKRRDARHHPAPTGKVILYLQAVAAVIWPEDKPPAAFQIKDISSRYRRTFKGRGSSSIENTSYVAVEPTLIKQAKVEIASTTKAKAAGT